MQKLIITLILCLNAINSFGQEENLKPLPGVFGAYDFDIEYRFPLRKLLFKNLNRRFTSRVIITPSFAPEYLLSIEQKKDEVVMIYNILSQSYWSSKDTLKTKTITKQVVIDKEFSDAIRNTLNYFLLRTKYPKEVFDGADGTTYEFMTYTIGRGIFSGQTWSPVEGTKLRKLTDLCETLRNICKNNDFAIHKAYLIAYCNKLVAD